VKRRELITLLGGAAATWPLAPRAQQGPIPVIGYLDSGSPARMEANLAGFYRGLGETGYAEGKNVAIEYRWARGQYDRLPGLARELVRLQVNVIAATRSPAPALAAKAATSTIPIVFQTGSDPVKDGLVVSLNRPGGNVTGATRQTLEMTPKRFGLISELAPKATIIALLVNPDGIQSAVQVQEMQEAARTRGLTLYLAKARNAGELDEAFAAIAKSRAAVLIQGNDPLFIDQRKHIVALTVSRKIPTIFFERESVVEGGLMSYSANFVDSFRQVGVYAGRILKGEKPADLPVLQPTKFEFVLNLKTAKALGLDIPPRLLAIADEVIE
jgi:putative ABC transport system substrate-binding protein